MAYWLRHYAKNRQVAGSIPDCVIGLFQGHNPSGHTMALGSTQPLTEMGCLFVFLPLQPCGCIFHSSVAGFSLLVFRGILITHNDAPQSVGLLWTSDQIVAETSA